MDKSSILSVLQDVKEGKLLPEDALDNLKDLPYKNMNEIRFDHSRTLRKELGEIIFCKGKTLDQLRLIIEEIKNKNIQNIIFSKVNKKQTKFLLNENIGMIHNKPARMVYRSNKKITSDKTVVVVSAGTADIPIAEEAATIVTLMGVKVNKYFDVGVAGLHRILSIYNELQKASVVICIAGMEGALPSVVTGLVSCPVISVPTSIGYGSNFKGITPLLSMLNSCAMGSVVVNIDNGIGAGYFAALIAGQSERDK